VQKFFSLVIGVPLAILLVLFALANRNWVLLSLDPFAPETPALSVSLPLFVVVFLALMLGVILGGVADWLRQGRYRREVRSRRVEIRRLEAEKQELAARAPIEPSGAGLPALRR
jgi:uncharacterized integral membrane protein